MSSQKKIVPTTVKLTVVSRKQSFALPMFDISNISLKRLYEITATQSTKQVNDVCRFAQKQLDQFIIEGNNLIVPCDNTIKKIIRTFGIRPYGTKLVPVVVQSKLVHI